MDRLDALQAMLAQDPKNMLALYGAKYYTQSPPERKSFGEIAGQRTHVNGG